MQPLFFEPILKRIRWGGSKLGSHLGKPIGSEGDYAESWEIADQPDGQSVISRGLCKGRTLGDVLKERPDEVIGDAADCGQFPLLIKFLDANDWLSLQVHPDDEQAAVAVTGGRGKTEAWVIVSADPGSRLCAGLRDGVSRQQLADALNAGEIEECLHTYAVQPGDCVFVPAGTVHALGPGIVLAEVQQQSNITYRLHDWGRVGSDGKPRPIHVNESLAVTDFQRGPVDPVHPQVLREEGSCRHEELVSCPYFRIRRHTGQGNFVVSSDNRFRILMQLAGRSELRTTHGADELPFGTTSLIPAACSDAEVRTDDQSILLEIDIP